MKISEAIRTRFDELASEMEADSSPADLMAFWQKHQNGRGAKSLFPSGGDGSRYATAALANFAANLATAKNIRLGHIKAGIDRAQMYESIADRIYSDVMGRRSNPRARGAKKRSFYDDPNFQRAAIEATRRANHSGEKQRIYRAYGTYHVRPANVDYAGEHVSFVEPDRSKNPRPRLGTKKPLRASSATGRKPTKRLVSRRKRNSRKGYFPNPVKRKPRGIPRYVVTNMRGENLREFHTVARAVRWAKAYAKRHGVKLRVIDSQ